METVNALGRRKAAVARVYVKEGNGVITINKKDLAQYFPLEITQYVVKQPLLKLGVAEKYDIKVYLNGGGFKGQAEALRLAIARALVKINPEDKPALKSEGFMTRDPRVVEGEIPCYKVAESEKFFAFLDNNTKSIYFIDLSDEEAQSAHAEYIGTIEGIDNISTLFDLNNDSVSETSGRELPARIKDAELGNGHTMTKASLFEKIIT